MWNRGWLDIGEGVKSNPARPSHPSLHTYYSKFLCWNRASGYVVIYIRLHSLAEDRTVYSWLVHPHIKGADWVRWEWTGLDARHWRRCPPLDARRLRRCPPNLYVSTLLAQMYGVRWEWWGLDAHEHSSIQNPNVNYCKAWSFNSSDILIDSERPSIIRHHISSV